MGQTRDVGGALGWCVTGAGGDASAADDVGGELRVVVAEITNRIKKMKSFIARKAVSRAGPK